MYSSFCHALVLKEARNPTGPLFYTDRACEVFSAVAFLVRTALRIDDAEVA